MSDEDESSAVTVDISTAPTLNDLFQRLEEADVFNIVDTITVDTNSQTIIFHLQKLLGQRAEEVDRQHYGDEDSADGKIRKLSEIYKVKYPELVDHFTEWKPRRQRLLKLLKTSSHNLERNSSIVSSIRIFAATADILGTFMRYKGMPDFSVANFLMENASSGGVLAIFLGMVLSKKIHANVKDAIKNDQESFEKIVQWFKQTEDLDTTIKSFFPYGIDKDVVKKIHVSSDNFDNYQKIFIAVVTSNVKQNVKLFKNTEFLDTAERFATSEAGKLWFHKVLLENDHYFVHTLNSTLCDEIQSLLTISPTENRDLYVDACRVLSSTVRMKIILNAITIISAGSNLWLGEKPKESGVLEKLLKDSEVELEKIQSIIRLLHPSVTEIDPILID